MYPLKCEKQAGTWSSVKTVVEIPAAHIQVPSFPLQSCKLYYIPTPATLQVGAMSTDPYQSLVSTATDPSLADRH